MNCIFCKIVKGEIDSYKIYEDDATFAFLDIYPVTKGHALVIPKLHAENIFDIDEAILGKVIFTAKKVSKKIKDVTNADGIYLSQSSGKAAGQEVMHFHLHIIPRYNNDGLQMNNHGNRHPSRADVEELKKMAEEIKKTH